MAELTESVPRPFVSELDLPRVHFGAGSLDDLPSILERHSLRRLLLITGNHQPALVARGKELVGDAWASTISGVTQHVPVTDAEHARKLAKESGADGLVALGGGSAIGLAKAVALTEGLPIIAVPTTYAGSEMTPIWGMTEGGVKTTGSDPKVLPTVVIYDPELTYGFPAASSAASGMNAVAHCVEAFWTPRASPITDAAASEGLRLLATNLPGCIGPSDDPTSSRDGALRGAWLAGVALSGAGTALHHKICHVLGGMGMPHAQVHAVVLPEVTAFLTPAVPEAAARTAAALGVEDAADGLRDLAASLGANASLAELGLSAAAADRVAEMVAQSNPVSPRATSQSDIRQILRGAGAPE